MSLARILMLASTGIVLALGALHLLYTFVGPKLWPRDAAARAAMEASPLMLTGETTVWKAWIGFNASHSLGALLFGLVYAYLALVQPDLLFRSTYLQAVGLVMLAALLVLAKAYWFSVPLAGLGLALALYLGGVALGQLTTSQSVG